MGSISALTLYNTIIILLSFLLMIVVWRMSHHPSRYAFALLQVSIIVLIFGYTMDVSSVTLEEKLFWNNLEYFGHLFIPLMILIIAIQVSGRSKWLTNILVSSLFLLSSFFLFALITNDYHQLFYFDVALAPDPLYSFVTARGPLFYLFYVVTLTEMILSSFLIWQSNHSAGIAQRRRTIVLVLAFSVPTVISFVSILMESWIPSELMVVTGLLVCDILLFVGTFGFELFRLLPFTFDSTVRTLKDRVLIVDEHDRLLYSNPALPGLIGQPEGKDLSGYLLKEILPDFPFQLLDDVISSENRELADVQLQKGRFYDLQVSKIHNRNGGTVSSLVIIKEVTEKKILEEDGKQARELYSRIFHSSPAAIVLSRMVDGDIIEVNDSFVKISGYDRDELIGHTSIELGIWKETGERARVFDTVQPVGQKYTTDSKFRRKDGTIRICRATADKIELGKVDCLLTVIEDVTERFETEEKIKSNEEKFRTLFNHAGDAIYITDMEGRIMDANEKALEGTVYTGKELIGRSFSDIVSSDDLLVITRGFEDMKTTGSTSLELTGLAKDDRKIPVEVNARTLTFSGKNAVLMISRDITERKEAERALRNDKERLDATLNNISEGVVVTDVAGILVLMNRAAEDMMDETSEKLIGRRLEDTYRLSDPMTGTSVRSSIEVTLETWLMSTSYRVMMKRNNGTILINESASPIFEGSRPVGAVLAFHDVSAEKTMEEEVAKAARLKTIGTLAGGIAHDFNNVLTIIMGNIELTRRSGSSHANSEQWYEEVSKALERAKDLSDQLLTFSKGGAPIKRFTTIDNVMEEAIGTVFGDDGNDVDIRIQSALGKVSIDEKQMRQALMHVLKNSREAMPNGGTLDISAIPSYIDGENIFLAPGEYVHLQVKDTGIGIRMPDQPHIFEPYFTTKKDHFGMGLTAAYSIVKAHGGHMTIDSEEGKGSAVHIYLPSKGKERSEIEAPWSRIDTPKGLKVLLMDDEKMILEVASEMLLEMGHISDQVCDGEEAVEKYLEAKESGTPYDLVVMDLTIPHGVGGKDAVAELLKKDPEAKVIVSSGYSNDPVMGDYRRYGFRYVMPKPYTMKEFDMAIKHAMVE